MPDDALRTDSPASAGDGAAPGGPEGGRSEAPGEGATPIGGGAPPPEAPEVRLDRWRRRWLRRFLITAGVVLVLVGIVIGGLWLYLRTEAGRGQLRGVVIGQIENLLADDATVTADRLEGNFFTGARLLGLTIARDGETIVTVDTVLVEYNLTTLLRQTFSASEIYVGGPTLYVRQAADGTFNTTGLLKPTEKTEEGRSFAVLVGRLGLQRGRAEIRWYNPDRDSTLVLDGVRARVSDFVSREDSLVGQIDTLALAALAPSPITGERARLSLAAGDGRFSRQNLRLGSLRVQSPAGTDLSASLRLTFQQEALPVFEADLTAAPLALADVRAFAGVEVYGDPRLKLTADSDGGVLTVALRGSLDDASVVLDGELTRQTDGPVRYRAEGQVRRLDPSQITRNPALAGRLTGDLAVNLQGTSLRALSGPFSVSLVESQLAGRQIDRLAVDGSFAAGRVTFDVDAAIPGARFTASGQARPFERIPTFQVRGEAGDVDLARVLPGSGRAERFAGSFAVVGRGTSLDTFYGTAAAKLSRAEIPLGDRTLRLTGLDLDADVRAGAVDFDAALAFPDGGRLSASGQTDLGADPLPYRIDEGTVQNLNLATLTGDPAQASDLTGTFSLRGTGFDPQTADVQFATSLRGSRYGTYALDAVDAQGQFRRGGLTFDASADLGPAGALTARGTARPFADPLAYDVSGTMRNLDLAALTGNPDQVSDLTGSFSAAGRGIDLATADVTARVRLDPSSYGDRFVDGADLALTLRAGDVTVRGDLDTPEGRFALNLSGRFFDENPSYAFGEGTCFSSLNLAALTGDPDLRSDLSGCFSGRLAGIADLATASGSGTVTLRRSDLNDATVESARVTFSLFGGALDARGEATLATPIADEGVAEGGRVTFDLQARPFDARPTYALRGRSEGLDIAALLGVETPLRLTAAFDVSGAGTDPKTMVLGGRVALGAGSTLGPVAVDTLETRFELAGGVITVDTLVVDTDVADARGGGTLALFAPDAASDFRLEGAVESLAPLNAYTEQTLGLESGTFSLAMTASPGAPLAVNGALTARELVVGEYAVTGIDGTLAATVDRAALDSLGLGAVDGRMAASFGTLSTPATIIQRGELAASLTDGEVVLDGNVVLDDRRNLDFAARFEAGADPPSVLLERGQFTLDGDTWRLLQPAQITVGDAIEVRGLLLTSGGSQQIAADGIIDFDGEQNFVVTVEGVTIDAITDLVDLGGLGGELSASLILSGPATAPLVDGTIALDDLSSGGAKFGALAAAVTYADGRLGLDAVLTHTSGETLTVEGYVPYRFALAPTADSTANPDDEARLVARADAFPVAWAEPFVERRFGYRDLGGALRLNLEITGTQGSPRLDGVATLTDGRLGVEATGRTYEPIAADLTFRGNRITLDDVRILDDEGRTALDITGAITLRELSVGEFDLTIRPDNFVAMDTRSIRELTLNRGPSPLRLTGTVDRPLLRGSVVVSSGDIYLTDELIPPDLEPVVLTPAQIREVEARFGRRITARDTTVSRFTDALDYDLTVQIERNVWLRSQSGVPFDIEFAGTVQATKRAFSEDSRLYGQIDLVRGSVETLGRQFNLQRGTLTFNGPALGATVDLEAALDIRLPGATVGQSSATILLGVTGEFANNPTIRLTSTPALDPADIVSLIATGQLSNEFAGTGALAGAAGQIGLGLASQIVDGLGSDVGLDLVQIEQTPEGLVLRVGKYFYNRLFGTVGFVVSPADASAAQREGAPVLLTLDYQLKRWLSLQGEYNGQRAAPGGGLNVQIAW